MLFCTIVATVSSFTISTPSQSLKVSTSTSGTILNLFGGNKGDGDKKPGMMDQLAMFKKAQEMAQKKQKLDLELQKMDFVGTAVDGNVKVSFKYVPVSNPMDPNPDYEATSFQFDPTWFEASTPENISSAIQAAIKDGVEQTNNAVAQKYAVLQEDLMAAFGNMAGGQK